MKTVTLVGAGGNIGSHLVPHLGRMPGVGRVTLVDRDTYEHRNLASQDILPRDVGKPKARVQGRRLRRINPDLAVTDLIADVADVPIGSLRAHLILAAVDSRRPRQCINEIAWRLGIPWCDSGVRADGLLARTNLYIPGADEPCLECAWSDSDYAQIEQIYPCQPTHSEPDPTNAPSCLGALAAAMLALECLKVLEGPIEPSAGGTQVVMDAQTHHQYVTRYRHRPGCRFDHRSWNIEKLPCRLDRFTVADALRLGDRVEVDRMPFVTRLLCSRCGGERSLLFLAPALRPVARRCAACGDVMSPIGFDLLERLDATQPAEVLRRPLRSVGLREGDVFYAGNGRHYEITCDRP